MPWIGPEPALGLTYTTQRSIIRNFFHDKHKEIWKSITNCKHSKAMIAGPSNKNTKFLLNKSRIDLRLIIGAITGHCKLNKHLHTMGLNQTTTCRRCNDYDETPLHLITNCPALIGKRIKIFDCRFLTRDELTGRNLEDIYKFFKIIDLEL